MEGSLLFTAEKLRSTYQAWPFLLAGLLALSTGCEESIPVDVPVAPPPVTPPLPPAPALPGPRVAGSENIYVANADGSSIRRLVAGGRPEWSPDGRRIAYHQNGEVRVIDADGSNELALFKGSEPTWSSNGARIAFVSKDGISVMNADGSGVRLLIPHDFRDDTYAPWDLGVGRPHWSPEGSLIAFQHFGDGDMQPGQVFVMSADGSNARLLSAPIGPFSARYAESDPSWTPDGSQVLYTHVFGVVATGKNGGVPNAIPWGFAEARHMGKPVSSPNGTLIAFNYGYGPGGRDIWLMSATGGDAKLFIPDAFDTAWSPDGSRIAFVSTRLP